MKRVISALTALMLLVSVIPVFAAGTEDNGNILKNGSFEDISLPRDTSWNFPNKNTWYSYGDGVLSDTSRSGETSVLMSDGIVGQKVTLEADKLYRFEIWVNVTASGYIDIGFFDKSTPVKVTNSKREAVSEWEKVTVDYETERAGDYVVGVYNRSKKYDTNGSFNNSNSYSKVPIYIDDASLAEVQREETELERVKVINKTISSDKKTLTYNLSVPSGTQGDIIAAVYDGNALKNIVSMRSSTLPQPLDISIDGVVNGKTVFYLWDSLAGMKPISLPTTDTWTTARTSSVITFSERTTATQKLALSQNNYPLYVGDKQNTTFAEWDGNGSQTGSSIRVVPTVTGGEYEAKDIKWTVSDTSVVNFSVKDSSTNEISVQGRTTGTAILTATLPDGTSESCYFTVIDNYNRLQVQRIELNTDSLTLAAGAEQTLKPIFYPKDYLDDDMIDTTLIWSSSDTEVAEVNSDGKITAKSTGTAIITAVSNDVGRKAVCRITVTDSIDTTAISADKTTETMTVGETKQLNAKVTGNSRVIWKSDNSYIADVSETGVVTAYANSRKQTVGDMTVNGITYKGLDVKETAGTVKIYATTEDGGYIAEYEIQVDDAPVTAHKVSINIDSISIPEGKTANITAVVSPSRIVGDDKNITWESSDESIVSVSNDTVDTIFGAAQTELTATGEGTATVTARRGDLTDTCTVTVTNGEVKVALDDITIEDKEISIDEVYQFPQLTKAEITNKKLYWLDSDETVATIDNEGNVCGYKTGEITVYAIALDSLSGEQSEALKELKYDNKTIGDSNEALTSILEDSGVVYKTCKLTVTNPSDYIRNLHAPAEAKTDSSVNLLWNRASLLDAADFDHYEVYCNGNKVCDTTMLGYTVEGLEPNTEYTFKVTAVKSDSTTIESPELKAATKSAPVAVLNVLDYGAKGNGIVNDTYAIQKAIDECPENGVVYLPGGGHIYYTGALFLKDDMTFKVDGIILGSINPTDYPMFITLWEGWRKLPQSPEEWANATFDTISNNTSSRALPFNDYQHSSLINAGTYDEGEDSYTGPYNAHNITICGNGMINANGFTLATNEGPNYNVKHRKIMNPSLRGRTILMQNAQDIYIKDIMTAYSPSWINHIIYSDRLTYDGVSIVSMGNGDTGSGWSTIDAKGHIYNGDGIDPDSCSNMNIFNLYCMTGDDAITLKSGRNKEGNDRDKPCKYIRMTDVHGFETLAGFGSGSEIASGAHDILIQNSSLIGSFDYGIWIKTMAVRGGVMEDFVIRDFTTSNVKHVVYMDAAYSNSNPSATVNPADKSAVIRHFTFENVGGGSTSTAYRLEGFNSTNRLEHLTIRGAQLDKAYSEITNCFDVRITGGNASWSKGTDKNRGSVANDRIFIDGTERTDLY